MGSEHFEIFQVLSMNHKRSQLVFFRSLNINKKWMSVFITPVPDFKSNEVHVKDVDNTVYLSFMLQGECHKMNRPRNELMNKSLHRFSITVCNKLNKVKTKKAKNQAPVEKNTLPQAMVLQNDEIVDTSHFQNCDFRDGMNIQIGNMKFLVVLNAPVILNLLSYPRCHLLVGFPISPQVTSEDANGFDCMWCQETAPRSESYTVVCTDRVFVPSTSAVDCRVKLFCTPWRREGQKCVSGRATTFYLSGVVQPAPSALDKALVVREHFNNILRQSKETSQSSSSKHIGKCRPECRLEGDLRVVTFNILAEQFATSEYAMRKLYSYCDPALLETENRIQRILRELLAYDADMLCLQECDRKTFDAYLEPLLREAGYSGHHTSKASMVMEGCATFVRTASLTVLRRIDLPLKNVLRTAPHMTGVYALRPDLLDIIGCKLGTVAQITVCQLVSQPDRVVLLANTHLFYHPLANYVRLLQVDAIVRTLDSLRQRLMSEGLRCDLGVAGEEEEEEQVVDALADRLGCLGTSIQEQQPQQQIRPSVIITGDLNSCPDTGSIEYLTTGKITKRKMAEDWSMLQAFRWGKTTHEEVESALQTHWAATVPVGHVGHNDLLHPSHTVSVADLPVLQHDLDLVSAAGFPPFSNYTPGFRNLLDYVFVQRNEFETVRVAPFPTEAELSAHQGLPSAHFPSDHLAIAVDIRLVS